MNTTKLSVAIAALVICLFSEADAQWVNTNVLPGRTINCFAANGSDLFVGTYSGVFLSTDIGVTWTSASSGLTSMEIHQLVSVFVDGLGETILFARTANGVFRSIDNGTQWSSVNSGLGWNLSSLCANTSSEGEVSLFAGTFDGIFRSTNNGTNWTSVGGGIVRTLATSRTVSGGTNIFGGVLTGGVILSTDNGTTWANVSVGLPNAYPFALATGGTSVFAATDAGLYVSTNNGVNWSLSNLTHNALALEPIPHWLGGTNLFAATHDSGMVSLSTDDGTTWSVVSNGMNAPYAVYTLARFGGYLIAGTGTGVWRRPLSEMITNFQGLAASYPFSDNANDISGNAHHGTPVGITLISDRFGNNTSAFRFSGAGSSVTTSWTGILGTQPRSVSMWVKKETVAQGNLAEFHGGGGGTTSHGSSWLCTVFQDTSLQVQIKTSDGSIAYAPIVDDDRWHHYVWVLPDTNLPRLQHFRVYQDGVQLVNTISSVNDTAWINTLSGDLVGFGQYIPCNGSIDAVRVYNVTLTNSEIQQLYHEGGYSISQYSFNDSWNLVSVPCTVADTRDSILFLSATSSAYAFTSGGYVIRDTLDYGTGYWVRFPASQTVGFAGVPRSFDSITVHTGWNMIGTVSNPILVTSVQQIPPTTIASEFYRYSGSYSVADTLLPSKGYWVKARSNGTLILSSALSRPAKQRLGRSAVLENASGIVLKDSKHESQTLYVTSEPMEESELDFFELPPPAPAGILDARFISNRILEGIKEGESKTIPIRVSSVQYPLTISWDMKRQSLIASLMVGTREEQMKGRGTIKVVDPNAALALKIGGESLVPKEYSLHQNYPNPFNPMTTIKYDLPVDSRVTLKIFSILGEEVGILLDEIQSAGYKSLEWNSLNNFGFSVASGVYFYRIEATSLNDKGKSFMQMKKMLLLK